MTDPAPYDPADIGAMLNGLDRGNPGRDAEVRQRFRAILAQPGQGGLTDALIADMKRALDA